MADMDTAGKRLSTLDWDQPFQPGIHIPSGSSTAGERLHGTWTYSGIAVPEIPGTPQATRYVYYAVDPTLGHYAVDAAPPTHFAVDTSLGHYEATPMAPLHYEVDTSRPWYDTETK